MFELIYTSCPRGLLPGRSGFATVAITAGMPHNLIVPLENLSGYNFTYSNGKLPRDLNPVCCYYTRLRYGNQVLPIAGRIAPCDLDYSQRNNKLAHHILLESPEELDRYAGGAAELLRIPGVFMHRFEQEPCELPFRQLPPGILNGFVPPATWQEYAGDERYANYIARQFRQSPAGELYIKYPPHADENILLQLICEVAVLLTPEERSNFTFNTFYSTDRNAGACFLRFIPAFSPQWPMLERLHKNNIIDLTVPHVLQLSEAAAPQSVPQSCAPAATAVSAIPARSVFPEQNHDHFSRQGVIQRTPPAGQLAMPLPPSAEQPTPRRQQIFIAIAVLLVILSVIAGLWVLSNPTSKLATSPQHTPPDQAESAPVITVQTTDVKKSSALLKPPIPYSKHITADMLGHAVKLPAAPALQLFLQFDKIKHNTSGKYTLTLPPPLHKTQAIYAELSPAGNPPGQPVKLLSNPHPELLILPASDPRQQPLLTYTEPWDRTTHLAIGLVPAAGQLQISFNYNKRPGIMPELAQISRFYFLHKQQLFYWDSGFAPEYLALVPIGRIELTTDGQAHYTPSDAEMELKNYVESRIGNCSQMNFNSMSFFFTDWNNSVKQYYTALVKHKKIEQQISSQTINSSRQLPRIEQITQLRKKCLQQLSTITTAGEMDQSLIRLQILQQEVMILLNSFFNFSSPFRYPEQYKQLAILDQQIQLQLQQLSGQCPASIRQQLNEFSRELSAKLRAIHQFRTDKKHLATARKNLKNAQNNLYQNARRTLAAAERIHPDTAVLLQRLMTVDNSNEYLNQPGVIDTRDIELIVADITLRIKVQSVEPLSPESPPRSILQKRN